MKNNRIVGVSNTKKKYYYGNAISDYGIENGYVDYGTLSKSLKKRLKNLKKKNMKNQKSFNITS